MPKDMRTVKAIIMMCHPRQDLRLRHLLSLERNQYYIQGFTACQAQDNYFLLFYSCLLAFIFTRGPWWQRPRRT